MWAEESGSIGKGTQEVSLHILNGLYELVGQTYLKHLIN
jgi:hypothetical protein